MTGKTHMAAGITAGLILSAGQPLENRVLFVGASIIGSLVPDLDHPKSKLNQKILLVHNNFFRLIFYTLVGAVFIYFDNFTGNKILRYLGIMLIIVGLSSHRSITHSLLGLFLFLSIVYIGILKYGLYQILWGFAAGYFSHLILDFFTPAGIQLFFPVDKNISAPVTIKTNGVAEYLILCMLNVYSIYFLFQHMK